MKLFLTSSPTGSLDGVYKVEGIDQNNHFREHLLKYWKQPSRGLMITAFPDAFQQNQNMIQFFQNTLQESGLTLSCMDLLDCHWLDITQPQLHSYDVIILGGGHVPTQNHFFQQLDLREKIKDYQGIVIGISAGTMNSADKVYAQPEEAGESINPDYQRWLTGLNLTKVNILPHYQMVKDDMLDGQRLYEDITYLDSEDHVFYALEDGSYLENTDGKDVIYGKAYRIYQRKCQQLNHVYIVEDNIPTYSYVYDLHNK